MGRITPFLWFDTEAEDAARFYTSVFPNSKITKVTTRPDRPEGAVMTVEFELDGERITALNGGPQFSFTEAFSFSVDCRTQEEVDRYWATLCEGGEEGPCGWLKDRFGLSWQVVPEALPRLLSDPDREKARRVFAAMMKMEKIEIAELERAAEGVAA
jgi:predicted 3-demethylubiquinone-9 3-methyltransferase (glyoxalase superfamily)